MVKDSFSEVTCQDLNDKKQHVAYKELGEQHSRKTEDLVQRF